MAPFFKLALLVGFCLLAPAANAEFGFKSNGSLDRDTINSAFFEGDFQQATLALEEWRARFAPKTREDSIFVFKYLSVIYASDSATRLKAESYMIQLLKLKPSIELVDLYISDNVDAIFKSVKLNHLKHQEYVQGHDVVGNETAAGTKTAKGTKKKSSNWIWWTAGGIGLSAAVGTTLYVLMNESDEPVTHDDRIKP